MARAVASLAALLITTRGCVGAEDLDSQRPERFLYEFPELVTLGEEPFAPPRELASSEAWLQPTQLALPATKSDQFGDVDGSVMRPDRSILVQRCVQVFQRTAILRCGRSMRVEVLSGKLQPIGGILVKVYAQIGTGTYHHFSCAFAPRGKASAIQGLLTDANIGGDGLVPEEKKGLFASVIMNLDICSAHNSSSSERPTDATVGLFEIQSGDRSRDPENRHLLERVPKWVGSIQTKAAVSGNLEQASLMDIAPICFPNGGKDVILSQGTCGSCWAFAASSAMMATICVSSNGSHSLAAWDDRMEISVQRLMSCNRDNFGCEGGTAYSAQASFAEYGPSRSSDLPYRCGSGDSLKHFEIAADNCTVAPWGGDEDTCSAAHKMGNWSIGRMYQVVSETQMKQAILDGHALYTILEVYMNLMYYTGGILETVEGHFMGEHAVTTLGFGFEGKKYWVMQNSWGTSWGENGFMKLLRGANFVNCESLAFAFQGSAEAGAYPSEPLHEAAAQVQNLWEETIQGFESGDSEKLMWSLGATLVTVFVCMVCCRVFSCCCSSDDSKY